MKIYVLGCKPEKVDLLAIQAGLADYDLEVLNQVHSSDIDAIMEKFVAEVGAGEVAGVISAAFAPWNPLGATVIRHCCKAGVPISETYVGAINWEKAFRKLAEQLPKYSPPRQLVETPIREWGIDRSLPPSDR